MHIRDFRRHEAVVIGLCRVFSLILLSIKTLYRGYSLHIFRGLIFVCTYGLGASQMVLAHGSMDQQIANASAEIAVAPSSAPLYLARGDLHRLHQDWDAALADFEQATSLDETLFAVHLSRGKLFMALGRTEEAHDELLRFVEMEPKITEGLITLARLLVKQGAPEQALVYFDRALEGAEAPAPDYYLECARACAALGDSYLPQAIGRLDEGIVRLGPLVVLETLALEFERRAQDFQAALMRIDRVLESSGKHVKWLALRAQVLEEAGRLREADDAYGEALAVIQSLPSRKRKTKMVANLEAQTQTARKQLQKRIAHENDNI